MRILRALLAVPVIIVANPLIDPGDTGEAILTRYLAAKEAQQSALRGVQVEVDIDAKLPRQEKHGKLHALKSVSRVGKITYRALGFSGDNSVKNEVIARYLAEEVKPRNNAITPANYKFKYKGLMESDGQRIYVFHVSPRKKAEGLFQGELWLDAETAMPIREAGRPVKTSILVKKMEFVQDYEIRNGIAYPKHFHGAVEVRIYGRAELNIDYSDFTRQDTDDDANGQLSNLNR